MTPTYFSDTERGPRSRAEEEISHKAWKAIGAQIASRIEDGSLGVDFPMTCPDGSVPCGCNVGAFINAAFGDIPDLATWHESVFGNSVYVHNLLGQNQNYEDQPPTLSILDLIQFCYRHIARTRELNYHERSSHHHLRFEREGGRTDFREAINIIFARNGLVYDLRPTGEIVRLAPPVLRDAIRASNFRTGETHLDNLLEDAVAKFMSPDIKIRKEALEKLWDAWERLKTLEDSDKKSSVKGLLDRAAPQPVLRIVIEEDAENATFAGNKLMIRHSEVDKEQIDRSEVVDYLFHRLFALILFVLRSTGRGS